MKFRANIYIATVYQLLVALFFLWATRFAFIWYNADDIAVHSLSEALPLALNGLRFDLSAVVYFNALFIAMRLLPFKFTMHRGYLKATDWIFWATNSLMLAINIGDTPYFRFTGSRLRWESLRGLTTESNVGNILASYVDSYYWFFIMYALLIVALVWCYRRVEIKQPSTGASVNSTLARCGLLILGVALSVASMRGRIGSGNPLSIPDAAWYVSSAPQINAVLNSPFCVLRSMKKGNIVKPMTFFTEEQLSQLRRSEYRSMNDTALLKGRNVVIITLESGSQYNIDTLNFAKSLPRKGLMPFLDSIASHSLVCLHNFATGLRSIEGICAIYGGIPTFDPLIYMLSPYNANTLDSPARLLARKGYSSRAYFGCNHGSFNIDQMLKASGFESVSDRVTYNNDRDYDGSWGIFDHAMGEYAAKDMSTLKQPFISGWFTLNAHLPFNIPDYWGQEVPYKSQPKTPAITVEYTDRALRHFFDVASRQAWYSNTVFIITGDHGCRELNGTVYDRPFIKHHVPFIVYTPDGAIKPRIISDRAMSQFDIAPTLLRLLGYNDSFISVGTDLLDESRDHYGIFLNSDMFHISDGKNLIRLSRDNMKFIDAYDTAEDPLLENPLQHPDSSLTDRMQKWAQALMQDYTHRLIENRLSASTDTISK